MSLLSHSLSPSLSLLCLPPLCLPMYPVFYSLFLPLFPTLNLPFPSMSSPSLSSHVPYLLLSLSSSPSLSLLTLSLSSHLSVYPPPTLPLSIFPSLSMAACFCPLCPPTSVFFKKNFPIRIADLSTIRQSTSTNHTFFCCEFIPLIADYVRYSLLVSAFSLIYSCSFHIDRILSKKGLTAAKRKAKERPGGKVTGGGFRARGRCEMCSLTAPPHLDVIRTIARPFPPSPPSPIPHFGQLRGSVVDLCDGLCMEVMSRKTYIRQWWWLLSAFINFW